MPSVLTNRRQELVKLASALPFELRPHCDGADGTQTRNLSCLNDVVPLSGSMPSTSGTALEGCPQTARFCTAQKPGLPLVTPLPYRAFPSPRRKMPHASHPLGADAPFSPRPPGTAYSPLQHRL